MGDQFERFILNNKDSFNEDEPSAAIWNRIEKRIRKKSATHVIWKVAAVFFLSSTLFLLMDKTNDRAEVTPILSQEIIEAEAYYVSMIDYRKKLIIDQMNDESGQALLNEINELDSMYQELKNTFQINASNERILDAMISNLQLRLKILNQQLEILEKVNKQTDEQETIINI